VNRALPGLIWGRGRKGEGRKRKEGDVLRRKKKGRKGVPPKNVREWTILE